MFDAIWMSLGALYAFGLLLMMALRLAATIRISRAKDCGRSWADRAYEVFLRGWHNLDTPIKDNPADFVSWYEDSPTHLGHYRHAALNSERNSAVREVIKNAFDEAWAENRAQFLLVQSERHSTTKPQEKPQPRPKSPRLDRKVRRR